MPKKSSILSMVFWRRGDKMELTDIFSYVFGAIRLRKLRAALTILGIVIGIAAIVALLSFGQGFQNAITM